MKKIQLILRSLQVIIEDTYFENTLTAFLFHWFYQCLETGGLETFVVISETITKTNY
jgi:hypothetical protein